MDYYINSNNNPRKIIEAKMHADLDEVFSEIVGRDISPYTVRYGSKGTTPDSAEWIDFRIEPFVRRAEKVYAFNLVHRSHNGANVKSTLDTILEKINKIVSTLET